MIPDGRVESHRDATVEGALVTSDELVRLIRTHLQVEVATVVYRSRFRFSRQDESHVMRVGGSLVDAKTEPNPIGLVIDMYSTPYFCYTQDHVKLAIELSERMDASKPAHLLAFLKVHVVMMIMYAATHWTVAPVHRS